MKKIILPQKTQLFILAALSLTVIVIFSYMYYSHTEKITIYEKIRDIQSVSSLKVSQIVRWRQERFADALVLTKSPVVLSFIQRILHNQMDNEAKHLLVERFTLTKVNSFYTDIRLYRSDFSPLLFLEPVTAKPELSLLKSMAKALQLNQPILSDFYLDTETQQPRIAITAPITDKLGRNAAIAVMEINPDEYLYPLIQRWPVTSKSSETVLLSKDDKSVLFLNELRHISGTALKYRLPLTKTNYIAVKAAQGVKGSVEGLDYRNIEVLGFIQPIPETNFIMISKIDRDEALADFYLRLYLVVGFSLILVLLSGAALVILNYSRQKNLFRELYYKEKLRREEHELFRTTLYSIGDAVITTNAESRILQMNPVAEHLTGWNEKEALGRKLDKIFRIVNEETRKTVINPVKTVLEKGIVVGLANHTILISKSGIEYPIADSGAPIKNEAGEIIGVVLVFRDQTAERSAEAALVASEERFRSLFHNMAEGVALHELILNSNNFPVNYCIINCNPQFEKILGLQKDSIINKKATEAYSSAEPPYFAEFSRVALTKEPYEFETYFPPMDRYFYISVAPWGCNGFATIFTDITERKRAEEEALISQKRVQLHFDLTPLGAIEFDVNFGIVSWNNGAEQIFGYTAEEVIGCSAYDLIVPEEYLSEIYNVLDKILRSNGNMRGINRNRTKDGRIITVEWYNTLLIDQHGDVLGIASLCEDITGRIEQEQALRNSEERLRRIFEESSDPILLLIDGVFIDCNPATVRKLGYSSKHELIGKAPGALSPELQPDGKLSEIKADEMIRMAETNGFHLFEWVHITSTNDPIFFEVMLTPFRLNTKTAYHVVWRDITERKQMIRELIAAKEKAEEMNRIKSNFFANMSHELRTPLIGILGYSEVLQDRLADNTELCNMAATINNGGKRLLETLNLILNLSKLESANFEIHLKRINLFEILNEAYILYRPAASKKNIEFRFTSAVDSCFCNVDEKLFRDILNNLVNNAVKYTAAGSIWIDLKVSNNKAVIQIGDTGIGIAREKHSMIWEEFRQVSEGYGRSFEGTGLGLTLTKKYTDLLGGTISIDSEEKKGSIFTLEFPLSDENGILMDAGVETLPDMLISDTWPPIIMPALLYVDDDPVSRDVVGIMTDGYYRIDFALTADEAMMKLRDKKYDAIILDINLGRGLDGLQLAQVIRNIEGMKDMPLIALTAYAMDKNKDEFLSKGFSHYISKPFGRDQILSTLNKAIFQNQQ